MLMSRTEVANHPSEFLMACVLAQLPVEIWPRSGAESDAPSSSGISILPMKSLPVIFLSLVVVGLSVLTWFQHGELNELRGKYPYTSFLFAVD